MLCKEFYISVCKSHYKRDIGAELQTAEEVVCRLLGWRCHGDGARVGTASRHRPLPFRACTLIGFFFSPFLIIFRFAVVKLPRHVRQRTLYISTWSTTLSLLVTRYWFEALQVRDVTTDAIVPRGGNPLAH